ncbi:D-TA family PLP-dependent enzyme [Aquimarina algiphila]|uniref:D-TA family PLP-dependent enzyme n=1 Tax=Aquimarina algiphila TaxID=2047982 RepID=UPI00232C3F02|nr:D-TA family PLP-dependent enzyme [Aquimarina algiphila]
MNWYEIENIDEVDSPSIALYKDCLLYNIDKMIGMVNGDTWRLMPHVKTNKMPEVIKKMISSGIKNFKASTISEAEIAAVAGADSVLVAHQLVGPKIDRFLSLITTFPQTNFLTIIDNIGSAKLLQQNAFTKNLRIDFFIDINNGMNRSGIELGKDLDELIESIPAYEHLQFKGLHVYDGHLRDNDSQLRKDKIEEGLKEINILFDILKKNTTDIRLICGGTPSFTTHLLQKDRLCSPGTCLLWDWGYSEKLVEQEFKYAAVLVSRVISKPKKNIITLDLGHKSVAAENPIHHRVKFLNLKNYELLSQSEEHGVVKVDNCDSIAVGDVVYGIPYHICPTINLHDDVSVIVNNRKITQWDIIARKRKISV